jgi:hypothetical protein
MDDTRYDDINFDDEMPDDKLQFPYYHNCDSCGASIEYDDDVDYDVCPSCGADLYLVPTLIGKDFKIFSNYQNEMIYMDEATKRLNTIPEPHLKSALRYLISLILDDQSYENGEFILDLLKHTKYMIKHGRIRRTQLFKLWQE